MEGGGTLVKQIEKIFTDPALGRVLFAFTAICFLVYLNHEMGLIHHYDLSRDLNEIQSLRRVSTEDPTLRSRVDSLESAVLEDITAHARPLQEKVPLWLLWLSATLIVPVPFFFNTVSDIIGKVGLENEGEVQLAMMGVMLVFALQWTVGIVAFWASESLLAKSFLPGVTQIGATYVIGMLSLIVRPSSVASLPDDPEELSFGEMLPDRVRERWSRDDSATSEEKKVSRLVPPPPQRKR